jgi:hypothetical protein
MATKPKAGYIYILTHPSEDDLYKIGVTIRDPLKRLAQHNTNYKQLTGRIVKETGQKWILKEYHPVENIYATESLFWAHTPFADMPFLNKEEVWNMKWEEVEYALKSALSGKFRGWEKVGK